MLAQTGIERFAAVRGVPMPGKWPRLRLASRASEAQRDANAKPRQIRLVSMIVWSTEAAARGVAVQKCVLQGGHKTLELAKSRN